MLSNGVVVMEGSLEDMLYKLHIRALPPSSHAQVIQSVGTSSKLDGTRSLAIWHQRLCHLSYPTILAMDRTEAVNGMILQNKRIPEFCQGCVLEKVTVTLLSPNQFEHQNQFLATWCMRTSVVPWHILL